MAGVLRPFVLAAAIVVASAVPASAAGWLPAVNLSVPTDTSAPAGPSVASDTANESFATWYESDGANNRVMLATHAPGLPWSAGAPVSDPGEDASGPALALSSNGVRGDRVVAVGRIDHLPDRGLTTCSWGVVRSSGVPGDLRDERDLSARRRRSLGERPGCVGQHVRLRRAHSEVLCSDRHLGAGRPPDHSGATCEPDPARVRAGDESRDGHRNDRLVDRHGCRERHHEPERRVEDAGRRGQLARAPVALLDRESQPVQPSATRRRGRRHGDARVDAVHDDQLRVPVRGVRGAHDRARTDALAGRCVGRGTDAVRPRPDLGRADGRARRRPERPRSSGRSLRRTPSRP